jgi:hypothetical protein
MPRPNPYDGSCTNPGCVAGGTKRCPCKQASYCSLLCQKENWPAHKAACKRVTSSNDSSTVPCVRLKAQSGGASGYEKATVSQDHSIFSTSPSSVTQKFGFPLLVQPPSTRPARVADNDNPHATWLMINPDNGLAPPEWQSAVGDCLVARADKKPLDIQTLAAITDYVSNIMNDFGDGMDGSAVAARYYSKAKLDKFMKGHLQMQSDYKAQTAGLGGS